MRRALHSDRGFTITELLVMVGLLGIVITTTYAGLSVIMRARDVSVRQAVYASDVAGPLQNMEKILGQAITVEQPAGNSISVLVDTDNNGVYERHVYAATGGQLTEEIWATDPTTRANTTRLLQSVWSYNNANPGSTDLFSYRDAENRTMTRLGAETDVQYQTRLSQTAKSVRVRVVALYDGEVMSDGRTIFMRNR